MPKWNPTHKLMPKLREYYDQDGEELLVSDYCLVCTSRSIAIARFVEDDIAAGWETETGATVEGVTAWAVLPKVYKEGKHEKSNRTV